MSNCPQCGEDLEWHGTDYDDGATYCENCSTMIYDDCCDGGEDYGDGEDGADAE